MKTFHIIFIVFAIVAVVFGLSQTGILKENHIMAADGGLSIGAHVDPLPTPTVRPIGLSTGPGQVQACVTPPANLVSWYRAEGNFVDAQGNNGGTAIGIPGFAPGKVGQAFNLDGVDDRIDLGNPASLQFTTGMTAEAWIRPDTTFSDYRTVVSKWSQSTQSSWGLFVANNRVYGILWGSNNQFVDAVGGDIPFGTTATPFTHIAMTYSATDGLKVYVNGVQVGSGSSVGNLRSGTDIVQIGRDRDAIQTRHFDGLVDELSLYNRALSAAEILSIFNAGTDGKCSGPPVTPSPTPTPDCRLTFTPPSATVSSFPSSITTALNTQNGCGWTLVTNVEWITLPVTSGSGPANITYNVADNPGEDLREGYVTALGTDLSNAGNHFVSQRGGACPVTSTRAARVDPADPAASQKRDDDLRQFYGFRDDVLAQTQRGRNYVDDYYLYAGEIMKLMIFNPRLFFRATDVLERYQPVVESVLNRERTKARQSRSPDAAIVPAALQPTIVYDSEINDIDDVLSSFGSEASRNLRETLDGLRRDVRDPQVQAEFGVRIERGEKRPLPSERPSGFDLIGKLSLFDLRSVLDFVNPFSARSATKGPEQARVTSVPTQPVTRLEISRSASKQIKDRSTRRSNTFRAEPVTVYFSLRPRQFYRWLQRRIKRDRKMSLMIQTSYLNFPKPDLRVRQNRLTRSE